MQRSVGHVMSAHISCPSWQKQRRQPSHHDWPGSMRRPEPSPSTHSRPTITVVDPLAAVVVGNLNDVSTSVPSATQQTSTGNVLPYSLPSIGPGADPRVLAVSPQVPLSHPSGRR